ncbi:MAG: serine hydrolase [Gemmatimonadales bacterium]
MIGPLLIAVLAIQDPLAGLDREVERVMAVTRTPGTAIGVLLGDRVLVSRGYGVRTVGRPEPVTEETVFAIGSATKSFTAAAVAMLVDEGALAWDDPARDRLAGLRLYDAYASAHLTIRDLLAHRSGLPRCDFWYGTRLSRAEVIRRIRFCVPVRELRTGFGYQNLMYLVAGEIVAARSGRTWDAFLRERVFEPLGMTRTTTTLVEDPDANLATPHAVRDGVAVAVPWRRLDNVAPAGSINSTLEDMLGWARFQLSGGVAGGRRLLSDSVMREMRTAQIPIENEGFPQWADSPLLSYGLGWFLWSHLGRLVVEHAGGIDGMSADVALVPDLGLGIVVLANTTESNLPPAVVNWVLDAMMGTRPRDWIGRLEAAAPTVPDSVPSSRDEPSGMVVDRALAGTYADSLFGQATVRVSGDRLEIRFADSGDRLRLDPLGGDRFRGYWSSYRIFGPTTAVAFHRGPEGRAAALQVDGMATFHRAGSPSSSPR